MKNTRGFFSKTISPFVKFFKIKQNNDDGNNLLLVHQTEAVHHTTKPNFKTFQCNLAKLCYDDLDTPIKIELWDNKSSGQIFL